MIDWSKPIETVPCKRNPLPVPCSAVTEGTMYRVRFHGQWFDEDGADESIRPPRVSGWACDSYGQFAILDGRVRNVVAKPCKGVRYFNADQSRAIHAPDAEEIINILAETTPGVEVTAERIAKGNLTHRIRFDGAVEGWIEEIERHA